MYFFQFKALSIVKKEELMVASGGWELPSDIISLDSTLTIATPKYHEVIRVAAKH